MFGRNKGQFFLLFSLVIIMVIFSIFFSFPSEQLSKSRENLENYVYLSILSNIEEEQQKIFEYFYFNSSLKDFEKNFSVYIRGKLELRNIEFKNVFLLASYDNIEANNQETLNISLLNLLGNEMNNINITFTYDNSSKLLSSLSDGNFFETSFSFNISSNVDYNLILEFSNNEKEEYKINIPLRIGKSKKIGFWVNSLQAERFYIKKDFFEVK
jgi:hypothetical protein